MNRNDGMRQGGPNVRRPRGRHPGGGNGGEGGGRPQGVPNRSGGGGNRQGSSAAHFRNQSFDSNGPDVRVRGNAWQVCEKYQSLARDATSAGDRVMAENYLQHAEHYYRITEAIEEAATAEQRQRGVPPSQTASAPSGANSGFGAPQQQPDVPSNYYAPDGQLVAAAPTSTSSAPAAPAAASPAPVAVAPAPAPAAAPVQHAGRAPKAPAAPVSPSPFFGEEEPSTESQGSEPQTLIAQR